MQIFIRLLFFTFLSHSTLIAQGVLAGTTIQNQANIAYQVGGIDYNTTSTTDSFLVDQVIDVHISWQDSAAVRVASGETDRVLTFVLTNLGNGDDNITLAYLHNVPPSQFVVNNARIYRDTNGNGSFDAAVDQIVSDANLSADTNATLFLVSDIPAGPHATGDQSHDGIRAISTQGATAGADNPNSVDIVVRQGNDTDYGIYEVDNLALRLEKSIVVHSSDGLVHTGTRLTYSIRATIIGGVGHMEQVVVRDTIPTGADYVGGTLYLDGGVLTDTVDADQGHYDGGTPRIEVDLGDLNQTVPGGISHTILFTVQVQ